MKITRARLKQIITKELGQAQLTEMIYEVLRPYSHVQDAAVNIEGYVEFGNVSVGGGAQRYVYDTNDQAAEAYNELKRRFTEFKFGIWMSDYGNYVQVSGAQSFS